MISYGFVKEQVSFWIQNTSTQMGWRLKILLASPKKAAKHCRYPSSCWALCQQQTWLLKMEMQPATLQIRLCGDSQALKLCNSEDLTSSSALKLIYCWGLYKLCMMFG